MFHLLFLPLPLLIHPIKGVLLDDPSFGLECAVVVLVPPYNSLLAPQWLRECDSSLCWLDHSTLLAGILLDEILLGEVLLVMFFSLFEAFFVVRRVPHKLYAVV